MANNITGQVWIIDTASASALSTTKIGVLYGVRWVSKTATAGDDVTIQDGEGRTLWISVASGSNYVEADLPNLPFVGLIVPVLDSGTLYLNFERP